MATKAASTKKFGTVAEYIDSLSAPAKKKVKELRKIIKSAAPGAEDGISYNISAIKIKGKVLIWYAGWNEHVSMYPLTAKMESEIKELSKYKASKGTIKFPINEPLPASLITKIIKFKLKEIKD